jgi:Cof subfamily protein (haloacid dehalogenase superfamily)
MKLVAFDLDGTLVGRDLVVHPRVRDAISRMRAAGIRGCIVTGRMYRATISFARELGLDGPVICYQGAAIIDPQTDEVLRDVPLPPETVRTIVDVAEQHRFHLQLYRNDEYYCEERNRFSDLYARLSETQPIVVPSLREAFFSSPSTKAVVIDDADNAAKAATLFGRALDGEAYVTRSLPEFVEMLNPAVDKGDALRFVAERLGIALHEVLAVGDSWNDEPLLAAAGFSVAMGSAPEALREKANAVVADVAHDGVAEAIERFVLA